MMAAQNPEVLKAVLPRLVPKSEFHNVDNRMISFSPYDPAAGTRTLGDVPKFEAKEFGQSYGAFDPRTGGFSPQGVSPKFEKLSPGEIGGYPTPPQPGSTAPIVPNAVPTVSMRPPAAAGGFAQVATGGPEKAPPGYDYADPADPKRGLVATPGGPATQLPGDVAGKMAMIQSSRPGLEEAKKYFLSDNFKSGAIDAVGTALGQRFNMGDIGRQQRNVKLAAEAAIRVATGANAPTSEQLQYADFYVPSVYDSVATRRQKINALERFQAAAAANFAQGRGGQVELHPDQYMNAAARGPGKDQARVPPPPAGFVLQ
jgi:hypothetical protein